MRPFVGVRDAGPIQRTETGDDDNGTAYAARILTKPYTPVGILHQFGVEQTSGQNGLTLARDQRDDQGHQTGTTDKRHGRNPRQRDDSKARVVLTRTRAFGP